MHDSTTRSDSYIIPLGAALGFMAVALGAFGTHALKDRLSPDMLAVWHTGVEYHLAHSLAAVLAGLIYDVRGWRLARIAGWCFIAGTFVFAGSLYALAVTGMKWMGAITPLGGLGFLAGWLLLAVGACLGQAKT